METTVNRRLAYLAVVLIIFGVVMRLLPHADNLAPVGAIAIFGGVVLPRRLAWWLPVAVMVISDLFIGFYTGMWFNWFAFALVGLFGLSLRRSGSAKQVLWGALGSSIIFFVVSNFGVWAFGNMYPHNFAGLTDCYVMGLPFFRNTFTGDLLYAGLLFGSYALASRSSYFRPEAVAAR